MTQKRHKHYQCIRAFADGWKIEYFDADYLWTASAKGPTFDDKTEYRIVPDADGWLPWYATEDSVCPVDGDVKFEVMFCDKSSAISTTNIWDWRKDDDLTITHYRIVKQFKTPQPKKKVTRYLAYVNSGGILFHVDSSRSVNIEVKKRVPSLDLEVEE